MFRAIEIDSHNVDNTVKTTVDIKPHSIFLFLNGKL